MLPDDHLYCLLRNLVVIAEYIIQDDASYKTKLWNGVVHIEILKSLLCCHTKDLDQ